MGCVLHEGWRHLSEPQVCGVQRNHTWGECRQPDHPKIFLPFSYFRIYSYGHGQKNLRVGMPKYFFVVFKILLIH
jgi:hypothetical protein